MKWQWMLMALATLGWNQAARAQDKKAAEDPAHEELRQVKAGLEDAFNKRDIKKMLEFLHPDVVVIWQNGEVSKGHKQVEEYYQRMLLNKDSVVDTITAHVDVPELSMLLGKDKTVAVSWGTLGDKYKLRDGKKFDLDSHWSATLVKDGKRWLIVNAHLSANVFENQVMFLAIKQTAIWVGGGAAIAGLLMGILVTMFLKRKKGDVAKNTGTGTAPGNG
ncbi:MAG TPA: nuclear transport factor 2 family protein [Gemmataceae bacterium]|nr:nuclear transport factor 2 family protein [Gemmataceae bacterium]